MQGFACSLRCRERKEIYVKKDTVTPPQCIDLGASAKFRSKPPLPAIGLHRLIGWHPTKNSPLLPNALDGWCCSASIPLQCFSFFVSPIGRSYSKSPPHGSAVLWVTWRRPSRSPPASARFFFFGRAPICYTWVSSTRPSAAPGHRPPALSGVSEKYRHRLWTKSQN